MAVAPADIKGLPSGEFASLSDAAVQGFISEAAREVSEAVFGTRYDDAVKYLAAHLLSVMRAGARGAAGPVVSESAGPVSRSYAAPASSDGDALASTSYGRRYIQIRQQCAGGPRVL